MSRRRRSAATRSASILCHCNSVSEVEIVACIRRGADSLEAVAIACDAGTGCGSCCGAITTILGEEAARRRRGEGLPEALLALPLFAALGGDGDHGGSPST